MISIKIILVLIYLWPYPTHSEERDSTTRKLEELDGECSSLKTQLSEAQAAREKVEGERKELETKTTEEKELREQRDTEVQRLAGEIASKAEDIQAKDKLIQKVKKSFMIHDYA